MPNKKKVTEMFDGIAGDYDLLNHLLSAGVDRGWRKKAVREAIGDNCGSAVAEKTGDGETRGSGCGNGLNILDLATGTGDFAIALARKMPAGSKVTGLDLSSEMLASCKVKVAKKGFGEVIDLIQGDCESLPFGDGIFDSATVAFGVRNFENLPKGISEMHRVLKQGGKAVILELSTPDNKLIGAVYRFYFHKILPFIGGLVSGNKAAYKYLPASVDRFPRPDTFCKIMQEAGFTRVKATALTFGICRMFVGVK